MILIKLKKPVEYSFQQWIRGFPETTHPTDRNKFLSFVRSICRFNAKKWKDVDYFEMRVLKAKPGFDKDRLSELVIIFEYLIDFYKTPCTLNFNYIKSSYKDVPNNCYIERGFKRGEFYEEIKLKPKNVRWL